MSNKKVAYGASQIKVLKGLEAVRQRPAMYVGSNDAIGLHHIFFEVLDNSVDEAMAGRASKIIITLESDGSLQVEDNGAGIPVGMHPETKKSALETVMTVLHAGGKFEEGAYKVSSGLHGVGVSCTNALSMKMITTAYHDEKAYQQTYKQGIPKTELVVLKENAQGKKGTCQRFWPDPEIFSTIEWNKKTLLTKIKNQAYLTSNIRFVFIDKTQGKAKKQVFFFSNGLKVFVQSLQVGRSLLRETFYVNGEYEGVEVDAALTYSADSKERVKVFANTVNNVEGGTHLAGFRASLTQTINKYAQEQKIFKSKKETIVGDDTREGLCAVVSVKLSDPQFEGQTKMKLNNPGVRTAVQKIVSDGLREYLMENPKDAKALLDKVMTAGKARRAAMAARNAIMRKSVLSLGGLPGKLAECTTKDRSISELFVVEGDSALGTAKVARDNYFQAVMPMQGKPRNSEKSNLDIVLQNPKIRDLVTALGCGVDKNIDLKKLRYNKIILLTDADVDGSHIVTLLLTFFYNYMYSLLAEGHVYVAQPPLFKIEVGKEKHWFLNDKEKDAFIVKHGNKGKKLIPQRFKGLGEMNDDQLKLTTMDPKSRVLKKIVIADTDETAKVFDMLMGPEVMPRRRFIQQYAKFALVDT